MNVHRKQLKGFTLIELMIATTLGLILLGGLVSIVAMVNTSFSDTRVLVDLQNRCRSAQMLLQNDLSHISVTPDPPRPSQADDGYLSLGISDGISFKDPSKTQRGEGEGIVYLIDSGILNQGTNHYAAFTVFNRENPFSFTDPSDSTHTRTLQTPYAEVIWFIYNYDLYRVVVPFVNSPNTIEDYSNSGGPVVRMISPALLSIPSKRIMHTIDSFINDSSIELRQFLVLPNVCHFCVQAYNPKSKSYDNISSLGDYFGNSQPERNSSFLAYYDTWTCLPEDNKLEGSGPQDNDNTYRNSSIHEQTDLVPSTSFLPGMRIIVRAFDPDSGTVRQFRVGQDFRTR